MQNSFHISIIKWRARHYVITGIFQALSQNIKTQTKAAGRDRIDLHCDEIL